MVLTLRCNPYSSKKLNFGKVNLCQTWINSQVSCLIKILNTNRLKNFKKK